MLTCAFRDNTQIIRRWFSLNRVHFCGIDVSAFEAWWNFGSVPFQLEGMRILAGNEGLVCPKKCNNPGGDWNPGVGG